MTTNQLTERLAVKQTVNTATATGRQVSIKDLGTIWASVKELSAGQREFYGGQYGQVTHYIKVRGQKNYHFETTYFVWNGQILQPAGEALHPAHRRFTVIYATLNLPANRP